MAIANSRIVASAAEGFYRIERGVDAEIKRDARAALAAARKAKAERKRRTRIMAIQEAKTASELTARQVQKPLSARQRRILEFIKKFIDDNRYPPSIRDIQVGCEISSTSVVDYNLVILEGRGILRRIHNVSRGIELLGEHARIAANCVRVPLAGEITPNAPVSALVKESLNGCDTIDVPADMLARNEDVYALKVAGEGFEGAFVRSGDIVVLDWRGGAEPGDMVIAERGGVAAAGRLAALSAAATSAGDDLRVCAKVVGLVRYC